MLHRTLAVAVLASAVLTISRAGADVIEIQFSGLDVKYDGWNIFDATSFDGGIGMPSLADPLTTVSFSKNGSVVGLLTDNVYADLLITDVPHLPGAGGVVTSSGNGGTFGLDLLTSSGDSPWGIGLNIDKFQVFYSGLEVSMAATGVATSIAAQDLPFGLKLSDDDQISIIFASTNLSRISYSPDHLSVAGFEATGTGSIRGVASLDSSTVPEPSSLAALGGTFIAGLITYTIRRRRRAR